MNGILNVLKPPGMTSHDVVAFIRKSGKTKKVGHTGTLDPNAAGVLPLCIGRATKISQFLLDTNKQYRVEMTLGIETDTEDIYGNITKKNKVDCTEIEIKEAIYRFIGQYDQIPPMYSALKIKGQKLYELARKGIEIERQPRLVTIEKIDILQINKEKVLFDVVCSKGTYIRTLCKDIGNRLGCGATMSFLLRTASSGIDIESAIPLERLSSREAIEAALLPMDFPLKHMNPVMIKHNYRTAALNGNKIPFNYIVNKEDLKINKHVRIYIGDQFIGVGYTQVNEDKQLYVRFIRLLAEGA